MIRDPFIREKFTKEQSHARQHAKEYFERYPKDRYQTEVESWRELQSRKHRIHDEAAQRAAQVMPWSRPFDDPIVLPKGKVIVTLKDAAAYIMALPKSEQQSPEWQAATEALLMAAEDRG